MAKKSDILWWKDSIRRITKNRADCYERLTVWQGLGDHVRIKQTREKIECHNMAIEMLQYNLTGAGVKEAV